MTAPAEDPRGGERRRFRECAEAFGIEGEYDPACCRFPKSCSPYPYQEAIDAGNVAEGDLEPPAAGRDDTDSGGEDIQLVRIGQIAHRLEQAGLTDDQVTETMRITRPDLMRPATRPAGDRAQPTQELREAIARAVYRRSNPDRFWDAEWLDRTAFYTDADELLALPAVAALLDAQAAVSRARVLIDHPGLPDATCRKLVRRALDGTT